MKTKLDAPAHGSEWYQLKTGGHVPLIEADTKMAYTVYKSDRKKAIIGDPWNCIEALGCKREHNVVEAYIGAGKDAYIVFEGRDKKLFARHYVIKAQAARVRDTFDQKGAPKTQLLELHPPTNGRTRAHRKFLDKRRRAEIKNGAEVKKREQKPRADRITRLGVPNRPRANIVRGTPGPVGPNSFNSDINA
jgi:hypothetical protein